MAARDEQETNITHGRLDDYVEIWSNNVVDVRKLEKEPRAIRITKKDFDGRPLNSGTIVEHLEAGFGVTYHVSTEDFNPLGGFRRKRVMTEEQKAAAGERLRAAREAK